MSNSAWDLLAGVFLLAILYMLVRPGSPAGQALSNVSDALSSLIFTATGAQKPGGPANPGAFVNLHPGTLSA